MCVRVLQTAAGEGVENHLPEVREEREREVCRATITLSKALKCDYNAKRKSLYKVEPLKKGQHGDEPFVLSTEVFLFQRFLFLSLKMKYSSCLYKYKRECNQFQPLIC